MWGTALMVALLDQTVVRERARQFCDALVAGDVDRAMESLSPELRRNVGEVLALLPLPASAIEIESVERGGAGWNAVLRLTGESSEDRVQTRWKARDGGPTIVEASHLSRTERAAPEDEEDALTEDEPVADGT